MYKLTNLREFNETKLLQPTDKRKRFLCYDYNTKLKKNYPRIIIEETDLWPMYQTKLLKGF